MKDSWIGPEEILAKKQKYLMPCMYHFYKEPPQFVRGSGMYMYDHRGKEYLDFYAGVSVHGLGHCHPEMVETICNQVKTLQHTTTIYLQESIVNLAEALALFSPWNIPRTFFCASATEAVEGACLLASLYTGRSEFIVLQNSLHGRTKLGMSLTGLSFWRTDPFPVGGISHAPAPCCYHCHKPEKDNLQCALEIEKIISTCTSGKIAAFIAEPIQGNGGITVPPDGYFPLVHDIVKKAGGLFIVDETQTGFGRTGKKFAMEHYGIEPDIVCGGKALGGGTPIGFFSAKEEIAQSYRRPGASTFGGNPVSMEAGKKFLEILVRENLIESAFQKGQILEKGLRKLQERFPELVGDVRGKGLMFGIELGSSALSPNPGLTDAILEQAKNKGLLLGKTGPSRNILTFMPPLIVTERQITQAFEIVEKILDSGLARDVVL